MSPQEIDCNIVQEAPPSKESTIMVLDDDESIGKQFAIACKELGIKTCIYYDNIEEAQKYLTKNSELEFIIVDVHMLNNMATTFFQLLNQHRNPAIRSIPIIALAGKVNIFEINILTEIGIVNYLMKPTSSQSIAAKLKKIRQDYADPNSLQSFDKNYRYAVANGEIVKSLEIVENAIKVNPKSSRLRLWHANSLILNDRLEDATKVINQILKVVPDSATAYTLAAKIQIKQRNIIGALRLLEKANHISPLNPERLVIIGELILATGRASVAENRFRQALKLYADLDSAKVGLARCLCSQGRVEEALSFTKNEKDKKKVANHLFEIGDQFLQNGCWQQCVSLYENAFLIINPTDIDRERFISQLNLMAVKLVQSGKFGDGIAVYERASRIANNGHKKAAIFYNLALAWIKQGCLEKAIESCKYGLAAENSNEKILALLKKIEKGEVIVTKPIEGVSLANINTPAEKDLPILQTLSENTVERIMHGMMN